MDSSQRIQTHIHVRIATNSSARLMLNYATNRVWLCWAEGLAEEKKKWGARSIHRPDRVNMKACRWIGVRACACALHFRQLDVRGPAGCQRKTRETESSSTTHAYCTARVYLCVLAQRGFLGADLSEFCCVSSSVGRHEYSWGPLVFGKSLVSFPQRAPRPGRGGGRVHRWGESMFHRRFTFFGIWESRREVVSVMTAPRSFLFIITSAFVVAMWSAFHLLPDLFPTWRCV